MEKKIILEFLDNNWEEVIAFLAGDHINTTMPEQLHECACLLSELITRYKKSAYPFENTTAGCSVDWAESSLDSNIKDIDNKGLLGKAETFRRNTVHNNTTSTHSIITENGLFLVQKQPNNEVLDPAFKKLVDSVL